MYKIKLQTTDEFEELEVKTMQDWKGSFHDDFMPGDYVDGYAVWELINCVPPANLSYGYFQCGEPHSHRQKDNGVFAPTYLTFVKVNNEPEIWHYYGACFAGSMEMEVLK